MRFALLLHYPEATPEELGDAAIAAGQAAFDHYAHALDDAGVLRSAEIFAPGSASTTLRGVEGRRTDGPLQRDGLPLCGVIVLEVHDPDAALAWAAKAPSIGWGAVEVRPVGVTYVDGAWR